MKDYFSLHFPPPLPSPRACGHILLNFFFELQKSNFFLVARPLPPPPFFLGGGISLLFPVKILCKQLQQVELGYVWEVTCCLPNFQSSTNKDSEKWIKKCNKLDYNIITFDTIYWYMGGVALFTVGPWRGPKITYNWVWNLFPYYI